MAENERTAEIHLLVAGRTIQADLTVEARIATDPDGLSAALAENPARFAWWAALEATAKAEAEMAANARDVLYADLYPLSEASLVRVDEVGKRVRPTVDAVKATVQRSAQYQQAVETAIRAVRTAALLGVARRAMEHRRESLLAIASNYRAELDSRLRDQVKGARDRILARRTEREQGREATTQTGDTP